MSGVQQKSQKAYKEIGNYDPFKQTIPVKELQIYLAKTLKQLFKGDQKTKERHRDNQANNVYKEWKYQ